MGFRRTVNITGLSTSDPLPGTPSEIDFTPGASSGGAIIGPVASFFVGSDVPSSITDTVDGVSVWGALTQASAGSRPLYVAVDTVDGAPFIALSPGQSLAAPASLLDFLSQGTSTIIFVWRSRKWDPRSQVALLDTSNNGATAGLQIRIDDDSTNNGRYRKVLTRVSNGSTWLIDEPPASGFYNNHFLEGKWTVTALQVSATRACGQMDHEVAYDFVEATTMPGGSPSPLVVSGGYIDLRCIWIKQGGISDASRDTVVETLSARFGVTRIAQIVGSPTTSRYYAFPSGTSLLSGDIAVVYHNGLNHSGDVGTIDLKTSSDNGITWGSPRTIQSDPTFDSRDGCLSRRLQNGDYLHNYFLQTLGAHGHETAWVRRSSDNLATWGSALQVTVGVTMGTTGFEACSAPILQLTNGKLLFPLYGQSDGEAHSSVWFVFSTNNGATWPSNVKVANGVADSISYAEICAIQIQTAHQGLSVGDVFAIIRDDTNSHMWETKSADNGATWSALVAIAGAKSSGRSLTQLASGEIQWVGRPNDPQAAVLTRLSAGNWSIPQDAPALGAIDAGMTNGDMIETSPGVITYIYSREIAAFGPDLGPGTADVVARPNMPEWQLRAKLPMVISPTSATVAATTTQQITSRGALPFGYAMQTSGSGSPSVSASGLYTAGASSGSDVVRVTDVNGQTFDVPITVTGGVTLPTGIDAGNLTVWWDPSDISKFTFDGSGHISTWTSSDAAARVLSAAASPDRGTSLNGKASVDLNGTTQQFTGTVLINTLIGASSWTVGFTVKDTGSQADSGLSFFNACILASSNDGYFSVGTTATQIYAGQDNAGAGTPYDIVAASASTAHYIVAQYDAGAGKIFISVDGGAFDAGTTVGAVGVSATAIIVGGSGVSHTHLKGSIGDIAVWKSKLAGANLTNLKAFLASTI